MAALWLLDRVSEGEVDRHLLQEFPEHAGKVLRGNPSFPRYTNEGIIGSTRGDLGVAAYFVCTMSIHDPETYRKYTALTPATLARHGGKFLTRGDSVLTVEGTPFTERMVIIEFPDQETALAWYHDADYQSAAEFRRLASKGRMILQAGRDNTTDPDPKV